MIPPTVHLGTRSPGEFEVFEKLQAEALGNNWTVLHSLDLPLHVTRKMGEIDFVILMPGKGVLCLSVKHHQEVTRTADGVWHLGQEPPTSDGPFKKARDDMFSLKGRLVKMDRILSGVPFGFAVLFTRATPRNPIRPVEWQEHEQIYGSAYKRSPLTKLLEDSILATRTHLGTSLTSQCPDTEQVDRMVAHLRPAIDVYMSPKDRANETARELRFYTDEQAVALDDAALNDRLLYIGPAGTGKSLLAVEMYRREVNAGRKTLLLCYNRLLRDILEQEVGDLQNPPMTIHAFLLKLAGISAPAESSSHFWDEELPNAALLAVLDTQEDPPWDSIVIDEAQDVLLPKYLDVIDQVLRGGISGGRWIMFGDFDRQAIYAECIDYRSFCSKTHAAVRSLRTNCRNTKLISKYAEILGGMEPGYRTVRRQGDGVQPEIRFYKTEQEQQNHLIQVLNCFRERFEWKDIVVLSAKRDDLSAAHKLRVDPWQSRLRPYSLAAQGLRFCSIHRFKGLEACAVVVTDIEDLGASERASLLYVATTRAVDRLVILANEQIQPGILKALVR
jgi:hypothetical protein